jgi:N-methylhydantoinase B
VVRRYDRFKYPPPGAKGGQPGGGSKFVIRAGTNEEELTPAAGKFELKAGHAFYLESAGGGGFGDPAERNRERLARDIDEGYVSDEAAREKYGI